VELVTLGVDVGQVRDPTAICVAEETRHVVTKPTGGTRKESVYIVRHVERRPLGESYPVVVQRIVEVAAGIESTVKPGAKLWLVVDVTGVGRPVFDLITEGIGRSRFRVTPATFTGTDRMEGRYGSREIRVGKAYMVSRLQALLQTGRVKLPETREARALARELLDYELRVTVDANIQAGAFKIGRHDDLATALMLSVLESGVSHFVPIPGGSKRGEDDNPALWGAISSHSTASRWSL